MRRPYFIVATAAFSVAVIVVVIRFAPRGPTASEPPAPPTVTVHGGGTPMEIPIDVAPLDVTVEPETPPVPIETVTTEPVPYLPPPSVNLTGATLGKQVVPGTDDHGDIGQLHYSPSDDMLYAAMVEANGLRSVWRLEPRGDFVRVFAEDTRPGEVRILGDGTGTKYVELNNPDRVYRTDDDFRTWYQVLKDKGIFWNVAADGKGTVYGALHSHNEPILYRSLDAGTTWDPWIDFREVFPADAVPYDANDDRNKLRHLHDVFFDAKTNSIVVGTGDIARYTLRSEDNGLSWTKVWGEGFTAHTAMSGEPSRYLLCPDKLNGPGIALFDGWNRTLKETFSPGKNGYAGFCYSIVNVDGTYYASFHTETNDVAYEAPKSGVVVSPNGEEWYTFLEWEPLTHSARTDIWLAAAPGRIYASINGRLYAFAPLDPTWFAFKKPLKR